MFNQILVPVDSSEVASAGILPYVAFLARGLRVPVKLATVLGRDNLEALEKTSSSDKEAARRPEGQAETEFSRESGVLVTYQGVARENGKDYSPNVLEQAVLPAGRWLGQWVAQLREQDIPASGVVQVGKEPAEEVLRLARQEGCGLIAVATHDRNLLVQALQGSVTNEIIRAGQVPVLAISPEESGTSSMDLDSVNISSILAPLDGSLLAEAALPYVEDLAHSLSLKIVLVRVVQEQYAHLPMAGAGETAAPAATVEVELEAQRADESDAQQYLQHVADNLAARGNVVQWELLSGPTQRRLEELAEQVPDNMIALASHGRSGLARWVLGSVAEDLVRGTGNPVLVIPSGPSEEETHRQ